MTHERTQWTLAPTSAPPGARVCVNGFPAPTGVHVRDSLRWCGFFIRAQAGGTRSIESVASGYLLRVHADAEQSTLRVVPSRKRDALTSFRFHALGGDAHYAIESAVLQGHFVHADAAGGLVLRGNEDARHVGASGTFKIEERA